MFHRHESARCILLLVVSIGLVGAARAAEPFEAFLETHGIRCHGPEKEKGELRIDRLSRAFASGVDSHRWAEVLEVINAGEMPPKKEQKPTREEITAFVSSLDAQIKAGRAARMASRSNMAHYRLSRKEYQNTVYDLLGVHYDPTKPGELNEDTRWHGYERIGSELSLSPSHVDRYYRAAELVIDRAFPAAAKEARKVRKTAAELRYGDRAKSMQETLDRFGIKRPLRCLIYPGNIRHAFSPHWFGRTGPEQSGLYKVRFQASGIRPPGGQPAHLSIGTSSGSNRDSVDGLIEFDITASEDSPQIYESEVVLEMPVSLHFNVVTTDQVKGLHFLRLLDGGSYIFTHSSERMLTPQAAPQMFDDHGNGIYSMVILDWVEWEGPLETEAEKARRHGVIPPNDATLDVVAEHLLRFAQRAWRRPVELEEVQDYLTAYRSERDAGEKTFNAYRVAMLGVLTSQHFLYLAEGDPTTARERLTDSELASRLSYFLWSSMPDDHLFAAAQRRDLTGTGLKQEVDRMLTDSRINRFIEDFPRQWLQLHRLGMFPPDRKLYPRYDGWLETSLRAEPIEYFRAMFADNAAIERFIESDWTMANARISAFYGIPEPKSGGFERIALKPQDNRGGLLSMGAVLGLTSDGTRHRPVHRGVWLSEAIFNKTPPPPPANVDPIEPVPPTGTKVTIRQRIEAHAKDPNCASCHSTIDPLGLAWDQYDAIGQWRTRERVEGGVGEDPLVDATGVMPDGRAFTDARHFKQMLIEDRDRFMRAFIEHLCTYGLRRVLTVDDQDDLMSIVHEAKKHHYGLKDIVRAVALSDLMRKR